MPLTVISLPYERELRAERRRLIRTLEQLTDDEFEKGSTLCTEWAPRDVLAHLLGVDRFVRSYLPYGPFLHAANRAQVERLRGLDRRRLMRSARGWAARPAMSSRLAALVVFGDLAIHHQDILRGLGRPRVIPDAVATAILREGIVLSLATNFRALRYRLVPTDGQRPVALPSVIGAPSAHGTREALGLWLAGRDCVEPELRFPSHARPPDPTRR